MHIGIIPDKFNELIEHLIQERDAMEKRERNAQKKIKEEDHQ